MSISFVLGGARSGKSRFAENKAKLSAKKVIYFATATAGDAEMSERIAFHQVDRPDDWQTIEEPVELTKILRKIDADDKCILVDCLTLWVTNLLCAENEQQQKNEIEKLLEFLPHAKADIIFVSNEVGHGIVPLGEINRRFVDESGRLHQQISILADEVEFIMAGLPLKLK